MTRQQHLLIVEDEPSLRSLMSAYLEKESYRVSTASDAKEALSYETSFDMALIDCGLPDEHGFVVARKLKARSNVLIIFVTNQDDIDSKLVGLEIGDDYITKPFEARELVARVRNTFRRGSISKPPTFSRAQTFCFGNWRLDLARRQLCDAARKKVILTRAEFDLLAALVLANGRVLSRDFLIDAISPHSEEVLDRTVDVLVSRLRKKLRDDPRESKTIITIQTLGYQLGVSVTEVGDI